MAEAAAGQFRVGLGSHVELALTVSLQENTWLLMS